MNGSTKPLGMRDVGIKGGFALPFILVALGCSFCACPSITGMCRKIPFVKRERNCRSHTCALRPASFFPSTSPDPTPVSGDVLRRGEDSVAQRASPKRDTGTTQDPMKKTSRTIDCSARIKKVGHRKNRKCDTCEACQRELDCGDCDFCQDKPKFGGRNLKRQKCRWRQCLRFAAEKNIPVNLKSSNHPVILERLQREKLAPNDEKMETLQKEKEIKLLPKLPIIKLERLDYRNGVFRKTEDGGSWIIGKPEDKPEGKPGTKPIKQEREENNALGSNTVPSITVESKPVENNIVKQEVQEEPMNLHCPVKTEEFIAETDDVEAADESTPVITQIFSFATLHEKNGLDQVLQEFLTELNEIPLPAHWEVLSNVGPTLQLVQRSKASTMAETVVHIQPGLHYHIVVREYTVPSFHELFQTHPSRLTTVDEVVELICDLEAYRPCAGLPREGPRSPNCQVLVYEEWCQQCSINPWPSGFVR